MNLSAGHEASGKIIRRVESESACISERSEGGSHVWRYFGALPVLNLKARKSCINCNKSFMDED